jgi:flavodoxin
MNAAVVYFSRTGNTKKIAEAMAQAIGCKATGIADFDAQAAYDLLLVGGAVYGGKLDPSLTEFIGGLDPSKIKRAVVFSTYFMGEMAIAMIKGALKERGVALDERTFCCKGKFLFMHRKYPGEAELAQAQEFAGIFKS